MSSGGRRAEIGDERPRTPSPCRGPFACLLPILPVPPAGTGHHDRVRARAVSALACAVSALTSPALPPKPAVPGRTSGVGGSADSAAMSGTRTRRQLDHHRRPRLPQASGLLTRRRAGARVTNEPVDAELHRTLDLRLRPRRQVLQDRLGRPARQPRSGGSSPRRTSLTTPCWRARAGGETPGSAQR